MDRTQWPMRLDWSEEDREYLVGCRDLPEVITSGKTEDEALREAEDALVVAIGGRMKDGDVPMPSAAQAGERTVALPAAFAAKLAVWLAWRHSGISKSELGLRLGLAEGEVRRILDPSRKTGLERLDAVSRTLGVRLTVAAIAA